MKNFYKQQGGFTLIETMIAVFILTLTVGGLLTIAANGYFSVRYSRNQIVANNLIQESLEYVRNNRDSAFQQGISWQTWTAVFANNGFTTHGCIIDPYTTSAPIRACAAKACEAITFYPSTGLYGYQSSSYPTVAQSGAAPYLTTYVRTISMEQGSPNNSINKDPNQLVVTVTISWYNGNTQKTVTQSILLTNWSI